jgi:hypothetical protein
MTYIPLGTGVEEVEPIDLAFHEQSNQSDPDLQPENLLLVDDPFTDTSLDRFTILSESTPGVFSVTGGYGVVTHDGTGEWNTGICEGANLTMPQMMITIDVISAVSVAGNAYEDICVGMAKDGNNFIVATWSKVTSQARLRWKIGGSTSYEGAAGVGWTPPFSFGFSIIANSMTFWYKAPGGSWTKICSYTAATHVDLKALTWTGWKPVFWVAASPTRALVVTFDNFKSGAFGTVGGVRDICAVVAEDGTPYIAGNTLYALAARTDANPISYCAVMTIDLVTRVMTQIGVIMVSRGGKIQNDSAGQLIRYDDGTYRLLLTTWGDAGTPADIKILYKQETSLNLLSGANVVGSMTQLNLVGSSPTRAWYDPYLQKIGSNWYLAYTMDPLTGQYPILEVSPDVDANSWTIVGSDPTALVYEGTRIKYLNGQYWVLTGGSSVARVYDTSMVYQGNMTLLAITGLPNGPAHPEVIPHGEYVYGITFDNIPVVGGVNETRGHYRQLQARRYGVRRTPP